MYVLPFVQPFIIRYTFDFLKYFSLGLILGAKWNGGRGFPVQFAVLLAGDSPFSVLVSDPVLKAVPAPNTVPSVVSRERRSCDALNRWVRRQSWASSAPRVVGMAHDHLRETRPEEGALREGAGLRSAVLFLIASPPHKPRDFWEALSASPLVFT